MTTYRLERPSHWGVDELGGKDCLLVVVKDDLEIEIVTSTPKLREMAERLFQIACEIDGG